MKSAELTTQVHAGSIAPIEPVSCRSLRRQIKAIAGIAIAGKARAVRYK
ncbi:MAG: hypothetical protein ACO1N9_01425 [Flavobacterium sp.]